MEVLVPLLIAGAIGVWVGLDARKHGMKFPALWGIGVFLVLIVFLPAYFIVRHRHDVQHPMAPPPPAPVAH